MLKQRFNFGSKAAYERAAEEPPVPLVENTDSKSIRQKNKLTWETFLAKTRHLFHEIIPNGQMYLKFPKKEAKTGQLKLF